MGKAKTPRVSQNTYKGQVKAAAAASAGNTDKRPSAAAESVSDGKDYVRVRLHRADQGGAWSILDIGRDKQKDLLDLITRLEKIEMKHAFTPQQNCKQYDMDVCPNKDATDRLAEVYDGLDTLVRFALDGTTRVYGARERNEFHLLWWDSDHEVWPSKKKHT
ncbi:hypothetical protein [uncultured Microbacterium sp.]|uniref:hypothetical protein n=1 Tax=uncultured Microbacterium sp. TaxID=191216 RepID=UPI0025DF29DB|nr:hypothetical protein [uncultured Microbacterium sp.]